MSIVPAATIGRRQFCLRFLGLIALTSLPGCGSSPAVEKAANDARQAADGAARIKAYGGNGTSSHTLGTRKTKGRNVKRRGPASTPAAPLVGSR